MHGEWGASVLYRWISFLISALFIKYGISANTVTGFSILLCSLLPLVLLLSPDVAYIYLALAGISIAILDCVDGNIARVTNTTSSQGQYLDFITDIFYRIFLYSTLGFLIQTDSVDDVFLSRYAAYFCLLAAVFAIFARLCRDYTEKSFSYNNKTVADNKTITIIFSFLSGLDQVLPIFILVAGIYESLFLVMIWILFYSLLDFIYTQLNIIHRLQ
jgi:phosphatidylglycerophosphate synthase